LSVNHSESEVFGVSVRVATLNCLALFEGFDVLRFDA